MSRGGNEHELPGAASAAARETRPPWVGTEPGRWPHEWLRPELLPVPFRALTPDLMARYDRSADDLARWRHENPSASEMKMIGLLATMGYRYDRDYQHEHKVLVATYVDFAWPQRAAIEVYGGVHTPAFYDRFGAGPESDAARISRLEAAGWQVLIVQPAELRQATWVVTQVRVTTFLASAGVEFAPAGRRS